MISALVAGLLAGLVSAPHCLGMCGPLAAYAAMPPAGMPPAGMPPAGMPPAGMPPAGKPPAGGAAPRASVGPSSPIARAARPLRWQIGRLTSYSVVGAIAGGAGAQALRALAPAWMTTALSIALGLALLAAAVRLVRPARTPRRELVSVGRRPRTPLAARILSRAPREPLALGLLTALLPCGALWSGALVAAGAGSAAAGALAMLGFALASGAALLAAGTIGATTLAHPTAASRKVLAACLAVGAIVTLARPLPALIAGDPAPCHAVD